LYKKTQDLSLFLLFLAIPKWTQCLNALIGHQVAFRMCGHCERRYRGEKSDSVGRNSPEKKVRLRES
jgi:hypothetical protein